MFDPHSETSPGTYHIRLSSMKASWFPETVRRVMADVPDDVDAIVDLSDVGHIDRFSTRALADALSAAARRGVSLAVAANEPEVRQALLRERTDRWAMIAGDMSAARTLLGLIEPQPINPS